jgi:hypothetical protein
VEKVRWPDVKGSDKSGLAIDGFGVSGGSLEWMNGPLERRRMACVIVGWKSPPNCECIERWVGSTWPREKNVERTLQKTGQLYGIILGVGYYYLLVKHKS